MKKATNEEPQNVTPQGESATVVLSQADVQLLTKRPARFIDFIRNSPLKDVELDLARDREAPRKVSL